MKKSLFKGFVNVRVSFGRNSAGALEIVDANDYYPFGMNHLKTGNSFYGQGSYKNYKYNGKELQETGMYAMDFRHYMPDVGRFTGMDRISEIMPDWTPYRFAFNNPTYFSDPTGLFEEGGNALATCPTCPEKPEFQPFINDPNNEYFYESDTNTVSKVNQIEEVVVTGQKSSSVNYAGVDNNISSSLWWTNTAVGAASAYTVYRGQYHLNNELWRYQPYGKQKIITPWSKMKNGKNYWNNNLASKTRLGQLEKVKGIRNIDSKLTKAGGVLLAADIVLSGEIKPSHIINGAMLGASMSGVGSIVAGAWFILDMGTGGVNYLNGNGFTTLSDVIDQSEWGQSVTLDIYNGLY